MNVSPFNLDSIAITIDRGEPNKRPFIFLHGNSQNSTCGDAVMAFFRQRGHTVMSYDLPGHGDSRLDTENYRFKDLIDLNQQILSHYNLDKPILCGHSLGGMIHAGTITKYQITDACLILCGSLDANPSFVAEKYLSSDSALEISSALDQYMQDGFKLFKKQKKYHYFENRHVEDEIVNILNRRYSNPQASLINLKTLADFDVRKALIEMNIPLLVLHGAQEKVIHPALVEGMIVEYKNIEVCWYPDNGHLAFYQQPEMTNEFLRKYYSRLSS